MKKRSGASSTNEPPEPLVFFVDRSLGRKIVAGALRQVGFFQGDILRNAVVLTNIHDAEPLLERVRQFLVERD